MDDKITVSAKTLDEAITKALIELQTTSDHLQYEVVQKESSGFLGFIGAKPCVIRARVMSEEEERKIAAEKAAAEKAAARAAAEKRQPRKQQRLQRRRLPERPLRRLQQHLKQKKQLLLQTVKTVLRNQAQDRRSGRKKNISAEKAKRRQLPDRRLPESLPELQRQSRRRKSRRKNLQER